MAEWLDPRGTKTVQGLIVAEDAEAGWAERTLDDSLQLAVAGGLACVQLMLMAVTLASKVAVPLRFVLLVQLVAFTVAVVVMVCRFRAWPALLVCYAALLFDYGVVVQENGALCYLTIWCSVVTAATPVLMIPRRRYAYLCSLTVLGVIVSGQRGWHPEWGWTRLFITLATAVALVVAGSFLIRGWRRLVRDTDEREEVVAAEERALLVRQAVAQDVAEDARVLHDTMINTLSAVAGGGLHLDDPVIVRQRCAHDVAAIEARLAGLPSDSYEFEIASMEHDFGIGVRRTGCDDDDLDPYVSQISAARYRALRGAVRELVRNAAKHSGADYVDLDVDAIGSNLVVTVSDDGRGFDGRPIAGRGLAESVIARAREFGIEVDIRSRPGAGTTVTLTVLLDPVPAVPAAGAGSVAAAEVEEIRRAACWIWAGVMTVFGAVAVAISRPASTPGQLVMLAIVGGLSLAAWRSSRDGAFLPGWLTAVLVLGVPAAFVSGLLGANVRGADVNDWPTVTMTPLLIVLLVVVRSKKPLIGGIGLELLAAVAATGAVHRVAPMAAGDVLAGFAVQFSLFACWIVFYPMVSDVGARRLGNQRRVEEVHTQIAARDLVERARARWTEDGVQRSLEILRRLADGDVAPEDHRIRIQCAESVHHLRQLLLLSPDLVHFNFWLGRALTAARGRSVTLTVRGCLADAPDQEIAESLGRVVLSAVAVAPAGAELTISTFRDEGGLRLLVVGPTSSLELVDQPSGLPANWTFSRQHLGGQRLIEVVARPDDRRWVQRDNAESGGNPMRTLNLSRNG